MATALLCLSIDDESEWKTKRGMTRGDEINSIPVHFEPSKSIDGNFTRISLESGRKRRTMITWR
jgi:hypothetical protein